MTHRFGGYNGVAREASKWCTAFDEFGWPVTRAGGLFVDDAPGDVVVRGMWADQPGGEPPPVDHETIRRLCDTHDLVVLDNAGTLFNAPLAAQAGRNTPSPRACPSCCAITTRRGRASRCDRSPTTPCHCTTPATCTC